MTEPSEPVDYTERLIETMRLSYPGLPLLAGTDEPDYVRLAADFGPGTEVCTPADYDWMSMSFISMAAGRPILKRDGIVVGWYEPDGSAKPFRL
jgi:hypothetical protein